MLCGPLGVWRGFWGGFSHSERLGYFALIGAVWRLVARDDLVGIFLR